jgi:hypothetical protein
MRGKALAQPVVGESDGAARGGAVRQDVEHHEVVNDPVDARGGDGYARRSELVSDSRGFPHHRIAKPAVADPLAQQVNGNHHERHEQQGYVQDTCKKLSLPYKKLIKNGFLKKFA